MNKKVDQAFDILADDEDVYDPVRIEPILNVINAGKATDEELNTIAGAGIGALSDAAQKKLGTFVDLDAADEDMGDDSLFMAEATETGPVVDAPLIDDELDPDLGPVPENVDDAEMMFDTMRIEGQAHPSGPVEPDPILVPQEGNLLPDLTPTASVKTEAVINAVEDKETSIVIETVDAYKDLPPEQAVKLETQEMSEAPKAAVMEREELWQDLLPPMSTERRAGMRPIKELRAIHTFEPKPEEKPATPFFFEDFKGQVMEDQSFTDNMLNLLEMNAAPDLGGFNPISQKAGIRHGILKEQLGHFPSLGDIHASREATFGFEPYSEENEPKIKHPDHMDAYMDATNAMEMEIINRHITIQKERREAVEVGDPSLLTQFAAGIGAPENLVPIPAAAIFSRAKAFAKVGGATAGVTAMAEMARWEDDPTMTLEEGALSVAFSGLLGGAFGAAGAHFHGASVKKISDNMILENTRNEQGVTKAEHDMRQSLSFVENNSLAEMHIVPTPKVKMQDGTHIDIRIEGQEIHADLELIHLEYKSGRWLDEVDEATSKQINSKEDWVEYRLRRSMMGVGDTLDEVVDPKAIIKEMEASKRLGLLAEDAPVENVAAKVKERDERVLADAGEGEGEGRISNMMGLQKLFNNSQFPWYKLKLNVLGGKVGGHFSRLAHHLVSPPGIKMDGTITWGATEGSVSSLTYLRQGSMMAAIRQSEDAYTRYREWGPRGSDFGHKAKSGYDAIVSKMKAKNWVKGDAYEGRMSPEEFNTQINYALLNDGRADQDALTKAGFGDGHANEFIEAAAHDAKKLYYDVMEADGRTAGVFGIEGMKVEVALKQKFVKEREIRLNEFQQSLTDQVTEKQRFEIQRLEEQIKANEGIDTPAARENIEAAQKTIEHRKGLIKDAEEGSFTIRGEDDSFGVVTEKQMEALSGFRERLKKPQEELAQSQKNLEDTAKLPIKQDLDDGYVHRVWLTDKIEANKKEFVDWLEAEYREMAMRERRSTEGAAERAEITMKRLTGDEEQKLIDAASKLKAKASAEALLKKLKTELGDEVDFRDLGPKTTPMMARKIDIPTKRLLAGGWIEGDFAVTTQVYHSRMARPLEMVRKFGSTDMRHTFDELEAEFQDHLAATPKKEHAALRAEYDDQVKQLTSMRDMMLGVYNLPENPDSWTRIAADVGIASSIVTQMGRAYQVAVIDAGKIIMFMGMKGLFGGVINRLLNDYDANLSKMWGADIQKFGEASETALVGAHSMGDMSDGIITNWGSNARRMAHKGKSWMHLVNLMGPVTDILKKMTGSFAGDKISRIALDFVSGNKISKTDMKDILSFMDEDMLKRIGDQVKKHGIMKDDQLVSNLDWNAKSNAGNIVYANIAKWDDDAAREAMSTTLVDVVQNTIMTPTAADRPLLMSEPVWRAILLYKGFSITATQRLLMAGVQQRDARVLSSMAVMLGLGYAVDAHRSPPYDDRAALSPERFMRAFELSGIGGVFTDVNSMIETATNHEMGLGPAMGLDPMMDDLNWAQRTGAVAGAVASPWLNLFHAFFDEDADNSDMARSVRRTIPLNNLWIWNDMFTRAQQDLADGLNALEK